MRALVEQTRQEQEAAIASLHQQHAVCHATRSGAGSCGSWVRDINKEVERSEAKLARVTAKDSGAEGVSCAPSGIRYGEGIKMLDVGWTTTSPAAFVSRAERTA